MNPQFYMFFPSLKDLNDEQEMLQSAQFEALSVNIFSIYDDVIENMNKDIDTVLLRLEDVARFHAKIDSFHSAFFQVRSIDFTHVCKML